MPVVTKFPSYKPTPHPTTGSPTTDSPTAIEPTNAAVTKSASNDSPTAAKSTFSPSSEPTVKINNDHTLSPSKKPVTDFQGLILLLVPPVTGEQTTINYTNKPTPAWKTQQ